MIDKARPAYGFWKYSGGEYETAVAMMEAAREAGIDHFDTADCYGTDGFGEVERLLGKVRKKAPSLFDGAELATKVGVEFGTPYNSSRDYVIEAVDKSLKRLNVDRIDLLYIHRPDVLTHPRELAETLDALVAAGKAKAIGVSNYAPAQVEALSAFLTTPLAAHQAEFSAAHVAPVFDGVFDQAMARGLKFYAWSPLAGGALFEAENDERATRVRAALAKAADALGCSISAAALAFVNTHPAKATPILGTKKPDRLKEAAAAMSLTMDRAQWYDVVEAATGEKLP